MKRREDRLLLDMLLSARIARGYVAGVDRERFESDGLLQDAVTRRLEILGQAASRTPAETRADHPAIPWSAIVGMRNRLIHEYFRVDHDLVWNVARTELDARISILEPLVPPEDG